MGMPSNSKAAQKWLYARAWYTAGRMYCWDCPRCGASGLTMADKCSAELDDPCPGFTETEVMHKEFATHYEALRGAERGR